MSRDFAEVPPVTTPGKRLEAELFAGGGPGGVDVYRETVQVGGALLAAIMDVLNAEAGATAYGALMRLVPRSLYRTSLLTFTASATAQTLIAADSTYRTDLVLLLLMNSSTTGTAVQMMKDDGTTEAFPFYAPPKETRGFTAADAPLIGEAVNKAWKIKPVTSISSLKVAGIYAKVVP